MSYLKSPYRLRSRSSDPLQHDGGVLQLHNPGNLETVTADLKLAGAGDARTMMDKAAEAFSKWSAHSLTARVKILTRALEELENCSDEAAQRISCENGKPLPEAEKEVAASLGDGRFQLAAAARMGDCDPIQNEAGQSAGEVWHSPVGVYGLITPWNFPLATVVRKLIPALAWGNTVVAKPAQQTPLAPDLFFDCLEKAGLPAGVAHLAIGKGSAIGDPLVDHPALRGISFTGSTEVGVEICRRVAGRNVRTQMEMGGKNAMVVLADADLDAAVDAARIAAFTCSGQWCTATSRVIVEASIYEAFTDKLVRAVGRLKMGPGHIEGVTFGPVASAAQKAIAVAAIEKAQAEGARLLCGGGAPDSVDGCRGHFVEPTVFDEVKESMELFREEVFGPVLAVTAAKDAEAALRLANASPYGLSFSVYTRDKDTADRFMREVEAGMVHHNLHSAFRHPAFPLSGWKESGRGIPECGLYARDFYTQAKAVYRA